MSFVVSARKYRPQSFDEVLGQEHVTSTLKSALEKDKLAHAFLFTGPRGVGKTTCARILAKEINKDFVPSDYDYSYNIFELDAASNNSVEHVRSLIEQVRFQPQQGKYKVFIIDEVHMLSQQAFNAFLKTLEEPPPYAVFILATTEKHKIIPTILSRCQAYDFRRVQISEMVRQMEKISSEEGVKIDKEALYLIGEKADGAMRDALSIYDRIVNTSEGDVSYQDVIQKLNILDYDYYFKVANALLKEDDSQCLLLFNEILNFGFEGDQFLLGLSEHFRNLFVSKDPSIDHLANGSDELKKRYSNQATLFSKEDILTALHLINSCDIGYPKASNKKLHVEIALLKLCYYNRAEEMTVAAVPEKKKIVQSEQQVTKENPPAREEKKTPNEAPKPSEEKESELSETSPLKITPSLNSIDNILQGVKAEEKKIASNKSEITIEQIQEIWEDYRVNQQSPSINSVLKKTITSVSANALKIEVPSSIAKEIILQETALFQRIRSELNRLDLEVSVVIEKEKFPETETFVPKTYLSDREKFEKLTEVNPNLNKLVKAFKLKVDK